MTHPPDEELDAWAYALLAPTQAHALERHVAECVSCAARLRETARLSVLLDAVAPVERSPVFTPRRLLGAALAAAALALTCWPRESPPPPPATERTSLSVEPIRSHARELKSLGRVVRYETLPDPSLQPDDPS